MGVLIDTSVLIAAERGLLELSVRPDGDEEAFLSPISLSELLVGVERADERNRDRRMAFIEGLVARLEPCTIGAATARIHARLAGGLAARAEHVGAHDLWLAASCIELNFTLATQNEREFRRVPGLHVEVWR